jgi:hypothetical protein
MYMDADPAAVGRSSPTSGGSLGFAGLKRTKFGY